MNVRKGVERVSTEIEKMRREKANRKMGNEEEIIALAICIYIIIYFLFNLILV